MRLGDYGVGHRFGSVMTFALEAADPLAQGVGCRRLGRQRCAPEQP